MTEESSATSQLSVAVTTTGMTEITGEATMTSSSSSSRGAEFYFQCAVVVIGVVGTATNALILYALIASKQHKKHVLIFNQNALDLFGSLMMAVTYSLKLCNIHLNRSVGYWLCTLLLNEFLIWCGMVGSVINLASITVERYLKIVHSAWSKKKLHSWTTYSAVAFSWITSFIYNAALMFPATTVTDGVCRWSEIGQNDTVVMANFLLNFVCFYVIVLFIFIFCYWRILLVIRHQAQVMAGHAAAGPSTAQTKYNQMQSNIVKTMIFVSAFYAISFLPGYVYMILHPTAHDAGYYASAGLAYLYTCTNPFVYAAKFDPVKQVVLRLIRCKSTPE